MLVRIASSVSVHVVGDVFMSNIEPMYGRVEKNHGSSGCVFLILKTKG